MYFDANQTEQQLAQTRHADGPGFVVGAIEGYVFARIVKRAWRLCRGR